jgi:hypothetical protein
VDDDLFAPQALTNHLVIFKTRLIPLDLQSPRVLMPELLDEGYSVNWASYDVTPATPERLHHSCRRAQPQATSTDDISPHLAGGGRARKRLTEFDKLRSSVSAAIFRR